MRLSFSTRGWGDVPWDELVKTVIGIVVGALLALAFTQAGIT
jgi:hypothetical protein